MQIEEIILKVLEEIKKQESAGVPQKKMLVIGEDLPFKEELEKRYESEYLLEFGSCFENYTAFDVLLLAELSPNTLQKLALGMDPKIGPVMESLIKGKEIFFLKEGLLHERYKDTCPEALYKTYEDSVKKIMEFGFHMIDLKEKTKVKPMERVHDGSQKKRELIGEKEIRQIIAQGDRVLKIDKIPLITPLAKDLMREYGIVIEKQEGGM